MEPGQAAEVLGAAASVERVGVRSARRLSDVRALFAREMDWIDALLTELAGTGTSPATNSATHLLEAGGKRVRPLALLLSAACFGAIPEEARHLAAVAELIHLATLLHDDVVDDAPVRRGRPAARTVWGNAVSVLAGDLLLTHALERTCSVAPRPVLHELLATLRCLVDGEVVQLRGRTTVDLRPETYFAIVRDKTASLFVWATRAGARVAGAGPAAIDALGRYGQHIGTAFQLVDDLLDFDGDAAATGKSLFADLGEGKLTLPLLLAIERDPGLSAWIEPCRADDAAAARRLADAIRALKTCDDVRARAREETARALSALEELPPSAAREMLGGIASEMAARAS